jgi:DNA-binding LacI/PurR family transcriptional regulator
MGTRAAQALLTQLSGEQAQGHTVLPVELVVRSSTAAAPAARR